MRLTVIIILFASCKKNSNFLSQVASITIVNALADYASIVAVRSDTVIPFYRNVAPIYYGSALEYGYPQGSVPLMLISSADTTQPLFQSKLNLKAGKTYSLFVMGRPKAVDTVFTEDLVAYYSDSSAGIRFINLLPDGQSLTINLEGNDPGLPEFALLGYKQISPFKSYSARNGITGYNFEIRDQATGNLQATFNWYLTLYKNNTVVISGSTASGLNVFQVNNY